MRLPFSALLALFAALPAPTGIQAAAVKWQVVPENNSSPLTTTESPSYFQTEPAASVAATRWQRLDGFPAVSTAPVRWAEAPQTPVTRAVPAIAKQAIPKPAAIARSVGRAFIYSGVLYPEVGFWVPTAFRQDVAKRGTLTFQIESKTNPYNIGTNRCGGWRVDTSNRNCSDSRWLAEFAPLIADEFSLGGNVNLAESIDNSDISLSPLVGGKGLVLAFGFQPKPNINSTLVASWIGEKLISADNTGPIRSIRVKDTVAADGGQNYALLFSKLLNLGAIFDSKGDPPALTTISAGISNGFFKPANQTAKTGLNRSYGPIANIGFSFNQHLSIFAEYADLLAGFDVSYRPVTKIPPRASILYHIWRGQITDNKGGKPYNSSSGTKLGFWKGALHTFILSDCMLYL